MSDPFELLPEDIEYLDANYRDRWKELIEGSGKFGLVIVGFGMPSGFIQSDADLMILIPKGYPASPLDMFYFDPPIAKVNGATVRALSNEDHFGRNWQRWSRHYQWNPGDDNLARHIEYVWHELQSAALT